MSGIIPRVTNIIVTCSGEDSCLSQLNSLPWYAGERGLVSCDDKQFDPPWYGGSKYLEQDIWIGAFSEVDVDALIAAIRQIEWSDPEYVQVFVSRDGGRLVEIYWRPDRPDPGGRGSTGDMPASSR